MCRKITSWRRLTRRAAKAPGFGSATSAVGRPGTTCGRPHPLRRRRHLLMEFALEPWLANDGMKALNRSWQALMRNVGPHVGAVVWELVALAGQRHYDSWTGFEDTLKFWKFIEVLRVANIDCSKLKILCWTSRVKVRWRDFHEYIYIFLACSSHKRIYTVRKFGGEDANERRFQK